MSIPDFAAADETPFAQERKLISNFKKAGLMIAGAAVQKYMMKLTTEQEIIMNVSDMIIETFASESVMLRVEKLIQIKGEASCGIYIGHHENLPQRQRRPYFYFR